MENKEFDNKIKYLKDIYDTNEKSHNIMLNNMQMSIIRLEELENKKINKLDNNKFTFSKTKIYTAIIYIISLIAFILNTEIDLYWFLIVITFSVGNVYLLKSSLFHEIHDKEITKVDICIIVMFIILLIKGIFNLIIGEFRIGNMGYYLIFLIWFLEGFAYSLLIKEKNNIFFILGQIYGTGVMIIHNLLKIFGSPALTDNNGYIVNIITWACIITLFVAFCVCGNYADNQKFKSYKYSLLIVFLLYMIPFITLELLPFIFNL